MHVKIKRVDPTLELPEYKTEGAVGFDLLVREDTVIPSKEIRLVPNNIIVETPEGYMFMLASRSSTPMKKSLFLANAIGIIDIDYSGPDDEIKTLVYNFSENEVTVKRGERISQGIFVRVDRAKWVEVEEMTNDTRGGFGSTGGHH